MNIVWPNQLRDYKLGSTDSTLSFEKHRSKTLAVMYARLHDIRTNLFSSCLQPLYSVSEMFIVVDLFCWTSL